MRTGLKFFTTPFGKLFVFAVIMIVFWYGLDYIFSEKEELKGHVNQVINEPLETVYNNTLTEILPDNSQQEPSIKQGDSVKVNPDNIPRASYKTFEPIKNKPVVFHSTRRRSYNNLVKPYIPPIGLYTANPSSIPLSPDSQSAPYGQLLRCELVQTVMTSNLKTPVIAMVTEPLWWNGKEIIPAGVIVHGVAASSAVRDRIGTGTKWVLVWPHRNEWNGRRLILDAIALACDRTDSVWAKIDGSAGIKGKIISNEDQKRTYAYMASFIAGLGEGLYSEKEDITGSTTTKTFGGSLSDSLAMAFQKSASDMADQMHKDLAKHMFYVEARAGTEFYLYIRQDIRISEASKGQLAMQTTTGRKRK